MLGGTIRKGQANLIIALAIIICVIIALLNLGMYIANLGRASDIRTNIISSITKLEKQRKTLEQERRYAFERALLGAGISSTHQSVVCNHTYITPNEFFPYIPFDQIYYWKFYWGECVSKFGATPSSPNWDPFCDLNKDDSIDINDLLTLIQECAKAYGSTPGSPNWDASCDINNDNQVDVSDLVAMASGTIFKCMPNEDEILSNVEFYLRKVALSDASIVKKPFEIEVEKPIRLDRIPNTNIYKGVLKRVYLEHDYDVTMIIPTDTNESVKIELVAKDDPSITYETNLSAEEPLYVEGGRPEYKMGIPLLFKGIVSRKLILLNETCEGNKTALVNISTTSGYKLIRITSVWNIAARKYEYYVNTNPSGPSDCSVGSKVSLGDEIGIGWQVVDYDEIGGTGMILETTDYKLVNVVLGGRIYFYPQREEVRFPDVKIGEPPEEMGVISYSFVPADGEMLCHKGGATIQGFSFKNCESLSTRVSQYGGFTDLYSYAKEYLFGRYGNIEGWQEYELNRALSSRWDAIYLKTLKVNKSGKWIPKEDWMIRLIRNLGCGDVNCELMLRNCYSTINFEGHLVKIWNCSAPGCGTACEDALSQALKYSFMKEFEQDSPTLLEDGTPFKWRIKVRKLWVNVTDICSGESHSIDIMNKERFRRTNKVLKLGLPLQLIFGSSNKVKFDQPEEEKENPVCKCNEQNQDRIGDRCLTDEAGACACKSVNSKMLRDYESSHRTVGEVRSLALIYGAKADNFNDLKEALDKILLYNKEMECNRENYCCPIDYSDAIVLEVPRHLGEPPRKEVYPCCKLVNLTLCDPELGERNLTYSCLSQEGDAINQKTVKITEKCEVPQIMPGFWGVPGG